MNFQLSKINDMNSIQSSSSSISLSPTILTDTFNVLNLSFNKLEKNRTLIFRKYYEDITTEKEKIDKLENSHEWDKIKKIGNPYELIYTSFNKKKKRESIASYQPISRSYFKMWEIYYNFSHKIFEKINISDNMIFGHLAEGPGGFMEASYNYRNNQLKSFSKNCKDVFYGITLRPTNEYIPDWSKMKKLLSNKNQFKIDYGNLYQYNDVKAFIKNFQRNKVSIVTADGGFDYSSDFNGQEISSCQIIFSECFVALNILKEHGTFVCKVFDLFTAPMIKILYFMSLHFEEIYLYKPDTSRPANSEKYLVCIQYKNLLSDEDKDYLIYLIKLYQDSINNNLIGVNETLDLHGIRVPSYFVNSLNEYNNQYLEHQKYYLQKTIKLACRKPTKEEYDELVGKQIKNAVEWCKKYNVQYN